MGEDGVALADEGLGKKLTEVSEPNDCNFERSGVVVEKGFVGLGRLTVVVRLRRLHGLSSDGDGGGGPLGDVSPAGGFDQRGKKGCRFRNWVDMGRRRHGFQGGGG